MGKKNKQSESDKIRFSIGTKLIIIISFMVIISLGSITALVSWLVHTDLQISAEESNFEMNRRSAMEAEITLTNVRSNSRILIQTITSMGLSGGGVIQESIDFFFAENPGIAAVFFTVPGGDETLLINRQFFTSRDIDPALADSFFDSQRAALGRAVRGETLLRNAAPHFTQSILGLFYPWQNGGVGAALFSSETLNNNFGYGINQSYMLNTDGEILVHADFSLIRSGTNVLDMDFIQAILTSNERNRQQLIEADFGVLLSSASSTNPDVFSLLLENLKKLIQPVVNWAGGLLNSSAGGDVSEDEGHIRKFVAYTKLNTAGLVVITGIEYDKVFEGIAATTRRNILLTIAVLSISIIFIWFFAKTISVPLKALAFAAREIEGGKFDVLLEAKGRDEIGVLTSGFQNMCSALGIFGRFTNREIAVKAMRNEIKPGGLSKHGTIFFSDIREFTAKCEEFTNTFGSEASNKIVFWLNNYFSQMIDCIEKTNGVVDKFIGDAVMAHWGTAYTAGSPRADAFNCVKAALMMRKSLYYLNRERKIGDSSNPAIRIGCGINSGVVTAGQLGSDKRMEYTVIGDPVNLASRVEALTKPLGADILISEDTWMLIKDKFVTEEMPSVTVKGKEKPVRIFAVINFAGEPKGPQSMSDVRALLGIEAPVLSGVDVNADEKKYKIGESQQG